MNPTPGQPGGQAETPGKIRTWWHPLLAGLLRWQLAGHYRIEEEVPVGQKPLQIDLLLLRKEQGDLPAVARQILAGLVEHLGEYTLIEFKSPSDTLRAGDFRTFLAYALLYCAQNEPLLAPSRLHLLVVAPRLTRPYRDELLLLGATPVVVEPGVHRLQGGVVIHPTWLLETEVLAGVEHPLLTVVSPRFLNDGVRTYDALRQGGYNSLVVYLAQQINQFRRLGKEFAMQHLGAEDELKQVLRDILATMSPEERLEGLSAEERLRGLPPEERLEGLSAEERLRGLPPEERLRGLPPEELERLRLLLQDQTKTDDSSRPE